ncbi:TPA: hypothetical protein RU397_000036 [Klebsiella pneumoniae]|nr:hypothetical protein [Klebsiella pneumoniae]
MNISTVNELIQSLESAGELSIREQKFLKLAKAYQQLAAENVALKESRNNLAEFIHEELDADYPLNMNLETPATDHIVAGIKADGVEEFAAHLRANYNGASVCKIIALGADDFAKQLREGADK